MDIIVRRIAIYHAYYREESPTVRVGPPEKDLYFPSAVDPGRRVLCHYHVREKKNIVPARTVYMGTIFDVLWEDYEKALRENRVFNCIECGHYSYWKALRKSENELGDLCNKCREDRKPVV
jgi:hypothetical protein